MRRSGTFLLTTAILGIAIGCNSILENEPGRLDARATGRDGSGSSSESNDSSATEPISGGSSTSGESSSGGASSSGASSSGASSGGTSGGVDAGNGGCAIGMKACGELCVSVDDPFYGCAGPACVRCDVPNATAACAAGACSVGACVPGFADCNGLPADGCESNLETLNDCGACGVKCPALKNADMACVAGTCTGTCTLGFGDCNEKPEDGCEKNLLADKKNCGACGVHCAFGRCEQGVCVWP